MREDNEIFFRLFVPLFSGTLFFIKKEEKKMKKFTVKRMVLSALLAGISVLLYYTLKFPLPIFPSFLDIQFSMVPIFICCFALGPVEATLCLVVRFLAKLPATGTLGVGELADLIIGLAAVWSCFLVMRKIKGNKGVGLGLFFGALIWIFAAVLANWLVLVPVYEKIMHVNMLNLCKMIPGINEGNYMQYYLLFACLPFNFILASIVSGITFLIHLRLKELY